MDTSKSTKYEPAKGELPEIPQRIRESTLTPHYVDADRPLRSRFAPPRYSVPEQGGRVPTTTRAAAPTARWSQAGFATWVGVR